MSQIEYVWRNDKPSLAIKFLTSKNLGRCYNSYTYKITSFSKLDGKKIGDLWRAGFLGSGQSYNVKSKCDGNEEPVGFEIVPCRGYNINS